MSEFSAESQCEGKTREKNIVRKMKKIVEWQRYGGKQTDVNTGLGKRALDYAECESQDRNKSGNALMNV